MTKFIESPAVKKLCELTKESYLRYWDERNGGNVSVRLEASEVEGYEDVREVKRVLDLGFDASTLAGYYYLVTGTGRYFRNVTNQPLLDLGLVRISEDGQKLDERHLSRLLWKMQAESIVVFPEGIGVIPYMTPGTNAIGEATASKMAEFRAVIWPHHGLFASGDTLDETYGLIEVIEKAAMIYSQVGAQGGKILQEITDAQLQEIAEYFHMTPHEGFLDV